jgi:hypothetical protein
LVNSAKEQAALEELARGEPREKPTAAEAEFGELLEELLALKLEFYFWDDRNGEAWMVAFLTFMTGPDPEIPGPEPEGQYRIIKTLRLDFDSAGIRGGWSTDNMDWDGDLRAEAAGVDMRPPQGISVMAEGTTPAELARVAAEWFERHWADWKREGEKPRPRALNRGWRVPWSRQ